MWAHELAGSIDHLASWDGLAVTVRGRWIKNAEGASVARIAFEHSWGRLPANLAQRVGAAAPGVGQEQPPLLHVEPQRGLLAAGDVERAHEAVLAQEGEELLQGHAPDVAAQSHGAY